MNIIIIIYIFFKLKMEYGQGNSIFNWLPQIRSKNIFERA